MRDFVRVKYILGDGVCWRVRQMPCAHSSSPSVPQRLQEEFIIVK